MSEKDKSQSKEMAELLAENPEAATYIAGVVQGMKLAKAGAQAQEDRKESEPAFKMKTSTMSGAGVGGEIDSPTPGQWESTEHEIPFALFDNDVAYLLQQGMNVNITYRGAMQVALRSGGYAMRQLRIVEGGMVKGFKGGSLEAGSQMEASVTIEVVRYKMECGAEELIAVDKLNDVYRVNGNDMLAAINLMT